MDAKAILNEVSRMQFSTKNIKGLESRLHALEITPPGSQVPSDWNAVAPSVARILNKPSIFSGAYADLSGKPTIPDELADLTADATHRTVTDTEKSTWNGKQAALGFTAEDVANKSTDGTMADNSTTKYPSQSAVVTYVAANAGGSSGWVTTFGNWIPLPTDNNANSAGQSNRQVCTCLMVAGNRVRVKFQGNSATSCTVDHASIGISNGTASATVATPVELLFSAASGCVIPAGGYIWSDEATLTIADLNNVVVIWDIAAAGTSYRRYNASGSGTFYYKATAATYNEAAPAGFSSGAGVYMVQAISVRTA